MRPPETSTMNKHTDADLENTERDTTEQPGRELVASRGNKVLLYTIVLSVASRAKLER